MDLPEEITVNIISWLPVKSLVRFTAVSKRWRSIILFDKQFANQVRRNKTLTRNSLLLCPQAHLHDYPLQMQLLDLETSSFREVTFPPHRLGVTLLGSCNGLVFIALAHVFCVYVWNPVTGFIKMFSNHPDVHRVLNLTAYGVGYLAATDEYKVVVNYQHLGDYAAEKASLSLYKVMSLKDGTWRSIEGFHVHYYAGQLKGTLMNEALHWLDLLSGTLKIVAFDLGKEEFWKMPLPDYHQDEMYRSTLGVGFGRCLCVSRSRGYGVSNSMEFWVMREYGVSESWSKVLNLRLSEPQFGFPIRPVLIMEDCTVALLSTANYYEAMRIRIYHKQEEGVEEPSFEILQGNWFQVINYEESLVSIGGYNGVESSSQS